MNPEQQAAQHDSKRAKRKSVVIIGLDPSLIDFSSPDFAAFPGLTAEKVLAGITAAEEGLKALGYDAQHCHIDFGQTAESVVTAELQKHRFDCILIGAGVRAVPSNLILFEKLMNVIHEHAPNSKICFNTNPSDTLDALRRWI
jgi:malate/lactate dehydrogenase